jgi:hypothetical protein
LTHPFGGAPRKAETQTPERTPQLITDFEQLTIRELAIDISSNPAFDPANP